MPTLRDIKQRMNSIGRIGRIASAMQIVSLNRLKKIEAVTLESRFYSEKIKDIAFGVADNIIHQAHPLLKKRKIKSVIIMVITSDKGLCGGFNNNIFRKFQELTSSLKDVKIKVISIGRKGVLFFRYRDDFEVLEEFDSYISEDTLENSTSISRKVIDMFIKEDIDSLFVVCNKFRAHLLGKANVDQLLPLGTITEPAEKGRERKEKISTPPAVRRVRDYIYEPSEGIVLDKLFREYLANQIYQAILESNSAEEMSRMLAMKQAADNTKELTKELNVSYHKTRQSVITSELLDIMAAFNL